MTKSLIMGKQCLQEVLKWAPERIQKVWTLKRNDDPLLNQLRKGGIPVEFVDKRYLTQLVQSESHQNVVAKLQGKKEWKLDEFIEHFDPKLLLFLDAVQDPQNVGAILRVSECMGVDAVVWSKNRSPGITPAVSKASVGASELIETISVSNLAEAIKKCQKEGYEVVVADATSGAIPLNEATFSDRLVLVMGAEGAGVQPLIKKLADQTVYIPMKGKIASLNVSQATSIFLNAIF